MRTHFAPRASAGLVLAGLITLALIGAPPVTRADEDPSAGDGEIAAWSWEKFFDYAGCAAGIVATVETGGLAWTPTVMMCARAVALHMTD